MKKIKLLSAILLIVIVSAACLTGCNLFNDPKDVPAVTTSTITIYVDNVPQTFTATYNTTADVGPLSKRGYYMVGIDDESGNRYFDEAGRSLLPWNEANPTTFYAKFEALDDYLSYTYDTLVTETVAIGSQEDYSSYNVNYTYSKTKAVQFLSALKGNPDNRATVSFSFDTRKQDNIWKPNLYIKVLVNTDETLGSITLDEQTVDFWRYTYTFSARASQLINGFTIRFSNTDFALCAKYIKNVDCKVTIFGVNE